jgi:hypothetical protein
MNLELSLETKLSPLQKKVLEGFVEGIKNMGCRFKITDPDGQIYESEKKSNSANSRPIVNRGVSTYVGGYIDNLQIGQSACIPKAEYDINVIQSTATARGIKIFGKDALKTSRNSAQQYIEVIRIQ